MLPQYGIRNVNIPYICIEQPLCLRSSYIVGAPYQNYLNAGIVTKLPHHHTKNVNAKIGFKKNATPTKYLIQVHQKTPRKRSVQARKRRIEILNEDENQGKNLEPLHRKLVVKLTEEEKAFYNRIYFKLCKNDVGKIEAIDAAKFIIRSELSRDVLKNIWLISSSSIDIDDYLEKDEFFVMLRLIALAQNNLPYTEESIEKNRPIPPLPYFSCESTSTQKNIFEIPEAAKNRYQELYEEQKEFLSEYISAKNAIKIWTRKFNSPNEYEIKKVVDCLKPLEQKNFLNLKEFQVACYLLAIRNKVGIPNKLPQNLIEFLERNYSNSPIRRAGRKRTLQGQNTNNLFQIGDLEILHNTPSQDFVRNNKFNINNSYNNIANKINANNTQKELEKNKIAHLYQNVGNLQKEQNQIKNELIQVNNNQAPLLIITTNPNSYQTLDVQNTEFNNNALNASLKLRQDNNKCNLNLQNYISNFNAVNENEKNCEGLYYQPAYTISTLNTSQFNESPKIEIEIKSRPILSPINTEEKNTFTQYCNRYNIFRYSASPDRRSMSNISIDSGKENKIYI